jgi:hypothetical protein
MATLAALRQRVFDNLYSAHPGERPFVQLLNGGITAAATSVVVDDGTYFRAGDIIEFQANGEQCYVLSVATHTLTVIRGWGNTTAAIQDDNAVILKNPRVTSKQVDDAITAVLYDMTGHGVFRLVDAAITLVAGQDTYELSVAHADILDYPGIVSVYYEDTSGNIVSLPFHMVTKVDSTIFTNPAVRVLWWGDNSAGGALRVIAAARYTDVTTLPSQLEEVLVLGVTARTIGKMIAPALQDPGAHSNRTVQPGQASRDARWYTAEYLTAVRREVAALRVGLRHAPGFQQWRRARRWA